MVPYEVLILGCGYTGIRVARRCLAQGARVVVTSRDPANLVVLATEGAIVQHLDVQDSTTFHSLRRTLSRDTIMLHSVPIIEQMNDSSDLTSYILEALEDRLSRIVYLSTTGVYGHTSYVDATTPISPVTMKQHLRANAEKVIIQHSLPSLVLRPAAIYGPDRSAYATVAAGRYRLVGDGSNVISHIHVDDLAMHVEAGLFSSLTGAYPIADTTPISNKEIASYCTQLLGLPMPPTVPPGQAPETLCFSRHVNGSAIRQALDLTLLYPSFRDGIYALHKAGH